MTSQLVSIGVLFELVSVLFSLALGRVDGGEGLFSHHIDNHSGCFGIFLHLLAHGCFLPHSPSFLRKGIEEFRQVTSSFASLTVKYSHTW